MADNSKKIQELLEVIKHKLDMLEASQVGQSGQLSMIKDQLSMMNSKLDAHSASLVNIEATLEGYADAYKQSFPFAFGKT